MYYWSQMWVLADVGPLSAPIELKASFSSQRLCKSSIPPRRGRGGTCVVGAPKRLGGDLRSRDPFYLLSRRRRWWGPTMCGHFTLFTGFVNGGSRMEVVDTCRGPTSPISHYYYHHYFYTIKVKWLSTCDMWPKSILHPTLPSIQEWTFFQNRCVFDNSTRICIEHTFFELSNQKTTPPLFWNK